MKKKFIAILTIACILLLSACTPNDKPTEKASSALASSALKEASAIQQNDDTSASSKAEELSTDELPIDITYISDEDEIDWETTIYQHKENSFEIPESWQVVDGTQYGLINGVFVIPPDADKDDFYLSAHVAIEIVGTMPDGADLSSESVQKDFFAAQIVSTYSKMGGLSDLEFYVWESENYYVYIAHFKRSNEQLSMYQATYYVMNPDGMATVQATYFDEDSLPQVNEVARHLINTYS